jgi:hypothetical protein
LGVGKGSDRCHEWRCILYSLSFSGGTRFLLRHVI